MPLKLKVVMVLNLDRFEDIKLSIFCLRAPLSDWKFSCCCCGDHEARLYHHVQIETDALFIVKAISKLHCKLS